MNDSEIVKKYIRLVYYMISERAINPSDIDDLVQEVFVRYVTNNPTFPNDKAARKWFNVVADRVCLNHYATKHFKYTVDMSEEEYESMPQESDPIAEVEFETLEEEQMALLTPMSKHIIFLFIDCGYSVAQIAKDIGEKRDKTRRLLQCAVREYQKIISMNV